MDGKGYTANAQTCWLEAALQNTLWCCLGEQSAALDYCGFVSVWVQSSSCQAAADPQECWRLGPTDSDS